MSTPGGNQELSIISESGLYTLILRSNKPAARPFRRWVTRDVLPALRRTGVYQLTSQDAPDMGAMDIEVRRRRAAAAIILADLRACRHLCGTPTWRQKQAAVARALAATGVGYGEYLPPAGNEGVLEDFLSERCEIEPEATTAAGELYDAFREWAASEEQADLGRNTFPAPSTCLYSKAPSRRPCRWVTMRAKTQNFKISRSGNRQGGGGVPDLGVLVFAVSGWN
jgi:hypothetical protein